MPDKGAAIRDIIELNFADEDEVRMFLEKSEYRGQK